MVIANNFSSYGVNFLLQRTSCLHYVKSDITLIMVSCLYVLESECFVHICLLDRGIVY